MLCGRMQCIASGVYRVNDGYTIKILDVKRLYLREVAFSAASNNHLRVHVTIEDFFGCKTNQSFEFSQPSDEKRRQFANDLAVEEMHRRRAYQAMDARANIAYATAVRTATQSRDIGDDSSCCLSVTGSEQGEHEVNEDAKTVIQMSANILTEDYSEGVDDCSVKGDTEEDDDDFSQISDFEITERDRQEIEEMSPDSPKYKAVC